MAFWSTQRVRSEQQKFPNLIAPFDGTRIKQGAYELALSREVLTTPHGKGGEKPGVGQTLEVPPGQFALLYTEEAVTIPPEVIAFISIKATVKLDGLVNISGFHVDPGFSGRLKFSVYNAGNLPIFLDYGKETFLIWFAELDAPTVDPYSGNHKNQNGIVPKDRQRMAEESHSPSALDKRLDSVETKLRWIIATGGAVLTVILFPLMVGMIQVYLTHNLEENKKAVESPIIIQKPPASPNDSPAVTAPSK